MASVNKENTLVLETTQGRVVIELRPDLAPNHVARIKELAQQGFYDGVVFPSRHRGLHGANWGSQLERGGAVPGRT